MNYQPGIVAEIKTIEPFSNVYGFGLRVEVTDGWKPYIAILWGVTDEAKARLLIGKNYLDI